MKDEHLEVQGKTLGITELGHIVDKTNGRYNGATVQLPTTNYHSNHETTSELATENFYKTLLEIL